MGMVVMEEEMSECCGSYFITEVVDDLGMCAACKEWSSVYKEQVEKMTDNQIAKYLEQIVKHCKAARANPTASAVHIGAMQDLAEHVVSTMKKEREDVTGAPV
jgi:predicted ATP-dependent serine protease